MTDEEIEYEQTVNTMVVMAGCLDKLAQRIEYTGDTTMNSYRDRAIKELAAGVYSASLAVKIDMEKIGCLRKERDALKAKLSTAQNYEAVIAAKNREIEGVKQERNRLNAKVNELMKKLEAEQSTNANIGIVYAMNWKDKLAAAERCIEDVFSAIENDCSDEVNEALYIISAYREKEEAK